MRGWVAAAMISMSALAAQPALARHPGSPDPAECAALPPLEEPLNDRTRPLPVPAQFAMILSATKERYAASTIYGGVVCIDTRGMTGVSDFTISADRRFLEFDWTGYEAGGHIVVDRTGKGQVVDTGVSPVSSPSRRRFAAVQQSEAAFGSLEGFGVWQVNVVGLRRLALLENIPSLADWRIDGWGGDDCIALSGIPYDRITSPKTRLAKLPRERYAVMRVGDGWILSQSGGLCPK